MPVPHFICFTEVVAETSDAFSLKSLPAHLRRKLNLFLPLAGLNDALLFQARISE
jgi:hypothetical protein